MPNNLTYMPPSGGLGGMVVSGGGRALGSSGLGMAPSNYSSEYGGRPNVPNPGTTASQAISANMANMQNIYNMANGINAFNTQAQLNDLMAKIPNYQQLIMQNSGNIMSGLQGQLPQDVIMQMIRRGAERGIQSGFAPGSANTNAAYLRALGLNSLQLQQQAHTNLQQTIQNTPRAEPFNIGSMLVTPEQMQAASMAQSIYNSAPDPAAAARAAMNAVYAGMGNTSGGYGTGGVRLPGGALGAGISNPSPNYGTYVGGTQNAFYNPNQAQNVDVWGNTRGNSPNTSYFSDYYQGSGGLQYDLPTYYNPPSIYNGPSSYHLPNSISSPGVSYDIPHTGGGWMDNYGAGITPSFLNNNYYDTTFNPNVSSWMGNYFDDGADVGGGGYFDFGFGD